MPFARSFSVDSLKAWDKANSGNAVRALFERWALPGEPLSRDRSLRLCVRDGYLNFYRFGQSVAAIRISNYGPTLTMHNSYFLESLKGQPLDIKLRNRYTTIPPSDAAQESTSKKIDGWIKTAESYASAEKRFVDDLVAANAGVIDLEMGLPAHENGLGDRNAPRMDIVNVQATSDTSIELVFWEAKCSNNDEVRARAPITNTERGRTGPGVVEQLDSYITWIKPAERVDEVRAAYQETARVLIAFYQAFQAGNGETPECVRLWKLLVKAAPADITVIDRPGLAIGNYCPDGHPSAEAARFVRAAVTFESNGHRRKLKEHGIIIHEVGPTHSTHLLPRLIGV